MVKHVFLLSFFFLLTTLSLAADWPQWRGPSRDAHSDETGLLKDWPKDGPKLIWQIKDAGAGYSTPIIVGDRFYVLANEGVKDEFVRAFSVADGKPAWSTRIGKVGSPNQRPSYPAARSTATFDASAGEGTGGTGLLYCLSSDGDLV